ncbi:MAG TPA: hypothetical protein VFE25_02070 [Opitutaceae bacterium]|nr:hypothetical protein [Opitutaceae bacterium]
MEAPEQAITRLLGALEVLFDQEAIHVAGADHAGILAAQSRITPVIERLASLCSDSANAALRGRVAVLLEKRRVTEDGLAAHIARIREDLNRNHAATRRLAKVAPAYMPGALAQGPQRLRAVS